MLIKKRIIIGLSSLFILSLVIVGTTGCVPKKSATAATVSLDVQSQITSLESKISRAEESLASLEYTVSKQSPIDYSSAVNSLSSQQATINESITSLTAEINALKTEITALKNDVATPDERTAYAAISGKRYVEVVISGAGNYPVVLSLYGTGLEYDKAKAGTTFSISTEYLYGVGTDGRGTMLVLILEPTETWSATQSVQVDIRGIIGDVYYASASTGAR